MLKVKIFDEEHEEDLEGVVNDFLKKLAEADVVNVQFSTSHFSTEVSDQIYCYSCLILYRETKK